MFIEDKLSVIETEKRLDEIDIPRCKNCKYYKKPICVYWHKQVSENDWCNKWEDEISKR